MSPFDMFKEPSMIPTTVSDQNGPILVGFPNEAVIADWPERARSGEPGGRDGDAPVALDDYPNDAELVVCAAADARW